MSKSLIVSVCGPTASGKTHAAIRIAQYFNTEIVSNDSRQFYREMKIGVASPDESQLKNVPHHFIGNISVIEKYDVAVYQHEASKTLAQLKAKYPVVVVVGGSGLYEKSLLEGLNILPDIDPMIRAQLTEDYQKKGILYLQELLKQYDPVHHAQIDLQNPRRLLRALEICLSSGQAYSSFLSPLIPQHTYVRIGINLPREHLYQRIHQRTDAMIEMGLLKECQELYPYKHRSPLQTIGYQEIFDYMDGIISWEEAVDKIKQHTRNFAKRQITWFKKSSKLQWFTPDDLNGMITYIENKL